MFTRQASQVTNALNSALPAASAQAMVQAMCNCAQTLEHRGPAQFNFQQPSQGIYPSLQPPSGLAEPYRPAQELFPPITPGNVTIEMPPWSPITWENIPFVDIPDGGNSVTEFGPLPQTMPSSPWPAGPHMQWNPFFNPFMPQPPVQIPGGMGVGPIMSTGPVTSPMVNTGTINNYGDTFIDGSTFTEGDTHIAGDTTVEGDTYLGGQVTNEQDVINNGPVFNNNAVNNFNQVNNFAPNFFGGPVFIRRGPIRFIDARIVIQNVPVRMVDPLVVYTRVWYDEFSKKLKGSRRVIRFLGTSVPLPDRDILLVTSAGASFNNEECDLGEVESGAQITYIKALEAGDS